MSARMAEIAAAIQVSRVRLRGRTVDSIVVATSCRKPEKCTRKKQDAAAEEVKILSFRACSVRVFVGFLYDGREWAALAEPGSRRAHAATAGYRRHRGSRYRGDQGRGPARAAGRGDHVESACGGRRRAGTVLRRDRESRNSGRSRGAPRARARTARRGPDAGGDARVLSARRAGHL